MAKKSVAGNSSGGASVPASRSLQTATIREAAREDSRPTKLKSSALLDTCVVYCGDWHAIVREIPDEEIGRKLA